MHSLLSGEKVYAQKSVLSARCDVLSAMFSGKFREGSGVGAVEEVYILYYRYNS